MEAFGPGLKTGGVPTTPDVSTRSQTTELHPKGQYRFSQKDLFAPGDVTMFAQK